MHKVPSYRPTGRGSRPATHNAPLRGTGGTLKMADFVPAEENIDVTTDPTTKVLLLAFWSEGLGNAFPRRSGLRGSGKATWPQEAAMETWAALRKRNLKLAER